MLNRSAYLGHSPRNSIFDTRETHWSTILLFLLAQPALLFLLISYQQELIVPLARSTNWIIHADLIVACILLIVTVGGFILWYGQLRPVDIGLVKSHIFPALLVTAFLWLITQIILVLAALFSHGSLALHSNWFDYGVEPMIGFFIAMLIGMALFEEIAYRGFLLPQLYLKTGGSARRRLIISVFLSQALFAFAHLPTRLIISGLSGIGLAQSMLILFLAGLFGVVIYLRTRNLLIVTGIHALVNAPTQIVESPLSPFLLTTVFTILLLIFWPRITLKKSW